MISLPRLPLKAVPYPAESLLGYLIRLSQINAYPSIHWFKQLGLERKQLNCRESATFVENIATLAGLNDEETGALLQAVRPSESFNISFFSKRQPRICPDCIKSKEHLDSVWEVVYASACPWHGGLLVDVCQECRQPLTWLRTAYDRCDCGANFADFVSVKADPATLYYNTLLWAAAGREVSESFLPDTPVELLASLSLNQLCSVIRLLCRAKGGRSNLPRTKTVLEAVKAIHVINGLFSEWPVRFYEYLDGFKKEDGSYCGEGLQQAFGSFYKLLYFRRDKAEYEFIINAFETYLHENWIGVIDNKYKRIHKQSNWDFTFYKLVSKKLGIGSARFNTLVNAGIFKCTKKQRESGRQLKILNKKEVNRISKLVRYMINKGETCKLMGISSRQFDELAKSKLIVPIIKAGEGGISEWWLDIRKIKRLMDKILVIVPKLIVGDHAIKFEKIGQAHLTDVEIFPDFIKGVIKGEIPVAGMKRAGYNGKFKLSWLYFMSEEILKFRDRIRHLHKGLYSIPELSIFLGIKQEVAYHLVNAGLIKCHKDLVPLRKGRVIKTKEIENFKASYISLVQIARLENVTSRNVVKDLSKLGVEPIVGGGKDGCRQIFYRRVDLPSQYLSKVIV